MSKLEAASRVWYTVQCMAVLYVAATPIGNREDITLRALRVLGQEVAVIFCEDTRVTKKLLSAYKIHTPLRSLHARSSENKIRDAIRFLDEGSSVAYVTDAGSPGISDPGAALVRAARAAGHGVRAVPGPSALTAALSISGIADPVFVFYGFLPHKKGRSTLLREIAASARTAVLYESPHRIKKTLASLATLCPHKRVVVARELTKLFEEVLEGTAEEILSLMEADTRHVRGEFVVMVEKVRGG